MNIKTPDKLRAVIIDDELHGRDNLKKLIETYCPEIELLGSAESVVSAKKLVNEVKPDLVFLDIHMPVLDGFDFLEEFTERNFITVFVSAHNEFGINAVKAGAFDYLLKPIDIKELKQTVKKLLILHHKSINTDQLKSDDKIILPAAHGFNVLMIDDIIRFEAEGSYTKVFTKDGKERLVSRSLKEFEDSVPHKMFYRVHKSHLINVNYIREYSTLSGIYITMLDGSKIEISRRRAPEFIQKIKEALKSV